MRSTGWARRPWRQNVISLHKKKAWILNSATRQTRTSAPTSPQDFPREAQLYLGPASISLAGAIANSYQWKMLRWEQAAELNVSLERGRISQRTGESRRSGSSNMKGGWMAHATGYSLCSLGCSRGALRPFKSHLHDTPKWGCQIHACATFYFSNLSPPAKKTFKCMSSQWIYFATRKASLAVLKIGHLCSLLSFHFLWRKLFILFGKYWSGLNYCY